MTFEMTKSTEEKVLEHFKFEPISATSLSVLRDLFASNVDYVDFLETYGVGQRTHWSFFSPERILTEIAKQKEFYDGASFGDSDEDQAILQREQSLRDRLVPFQEKEGELFCFLRTPGRAWPILDIYHDDFELDGIDAENHAYTSDFETHLKWMLGAIDGQHYPPFSGK